jgi:hypothetical protein
LQSERPAQLYAQLLDIILRTQSALRDSTHVEGLRQLLQEHNAVMQALQEMEASNDVALLDLLQQIHNTIGEIVREAELERQAVGGRLSELEAKKTQLAAYTKAAQL